MPRAPLTAGPSNRTARLLAAASIVAAGAWAVVRSGIDVSPGIREAYQTALIWPEAIQDGFSDFYADSPIGILVFRALGLTSQYSFLLLATATAAVAMTALVAWTAWATASGQRARAARFALLAPLPAVLLTWLGFYDAYTMLAWAVALWAWALAPRWLLAATGVALGFQHFEQAVMGLAALWLTWLAVREHLPRRLAVRSPLWLLPGLLVGKAMLVLATTGAGSDASGRTSGIGSYLREWLVTAANVGPTLLWALFAGSWAIVIAWWLHEPRKRARVLLVGAFALGVAATLLTGDRPRVFVIVMAPALAVLTVALLSSGRLSPRSLAFVEAMVWLAPPVALWGAEIVSADALDHLIMTWGSLTGG